MHNIQKINDFFVAIPKNYKGIVGVNAFGTSVTFNFPTEDWIKLTKTLALEFPQILFILLTFEENPYKFEPFTLDNIVVFENNKDLMNLVAITKRLDLLLGLNSGNIHIADNLRIPTLILNKTKERYNCIGGSYGGEFDAVFLPKNWKKNYGFYYDSYLQKARQKILDF